MPSPLTIGLIGLDTSHVGAFARLLHDESDPHHVPGARIVAAYPGGTAGWPLSEGRVPGFTQELREKYAVNMLDSERAVAEAVDLVMITTINGKEHRRLFDEVLPAGKPVFIDKPFTTTETEAHAMVASAASAGVPLMSCSSLRYAEPFVQALADDTDGPVVGIDVYGPMAIEPALPGYLWYGCHGIEMVVAAMGAGCETIHASVEANTDVLVMAWRDGRLATFRGQRGSHSRFGATIHRAKSSTPINASGAAKPYYAGMLEAILASLPKGDSAVPPAEMVEIVRIMERANTLRGIE